MQRSSIDAWAVSIGSPGASSRDRYGPSASQFVELSTPATAGAPLAVLIHGGFWKSAYDAELARPLVPSLLDQGWATLVVEYRRVGDGGGYPATLDDVAAAVDLLADLDADVDLTRRGRGRALGGRPPRGVAGRATGVTRRRTRRPPSGDGERRRRPGGCARSACRGGGPAGRRRGRPVPRWQPGAGAPGLRPADPTAALPLGVPVLCVHGREDDTVPLRQSTTFAERGVAAGDPVEVRLVDGDHYVVIDPAGQAWSLTLDWLAEHA